MAKSQNPPLSQGPSKMAFLVIFKGVQQFLGGPFFPSFSLYSPSFSLVFLGFLCFLKFFGCFGMLSYGVSLSMLMVFGNISNLKTRAPCDENLLGGPRHASLSACQRHQPAVGACCAWAWSRPASQLGILGFPKKSQDVLRKSYDFLENPTIFLDNPRIF